MAAIELARGMLDMADGQFFLKPDDMLGKSFRECRAWKIEKRHNTPEHKSTLCVWAHSVLFT